MRRLWRRGWIGIGGGTARGALPPRSRSRSLRLGPRRRVHACFGSDRAQRRRDGQHAKAYSRRRDCLRSSRSFCGSGVSELGDIFSCVVLYCSVGTALDAFTHYTFFGCRTSLTHGVAQKPQLLCAQAVGTEHAVSRRRSARARVTVCLYTLYVYLER